MELQVFMEFIILFNDNAASWSVRLIIERNKREGDRTWVSTKIVHNSMRMRDRVTAERHWLIQTRRVSANDDYSITSAKQLGLIYMHVSIGAYW